MEGPSVSGRYFVFRWPLRAARHRMATKGRRERGVDGLGCGMGGGIFWRRCFWGGDRGEMSGIIIIQGRDRALKGSS
jgi:hypothetical protein